MDRTVKAIITTLDNLPLLKEQIEVLKYDRFVREIVVVSNGSKDGTNDWLEKQDGLTVVIRENDGAGPGRNAGLEAAGPADYYLMLDGGIRPLIDGTQRMLEFLERRDDVDVIGVEIPHFETDRTKAWRRWPNRIGDNDTYRNTRLSHTAYCLARYKAFDGLRFCEDGPFGMPGWGADDDEMAYQWNDAGIVIHSVTNIHPFRRGSGSFRRLFQETGVWPNQYGSVYEMRVVWLQQNWPKYQPGVQWGEPWLTVIVKLTDLEETIKTIKLAHDSLRERRFAGRYSFAWNPYHIVVWCESDKDFLSWSESRRLRQHHGDTTVVDGKVVKRNKENEALWTGDFRILQKTTLKYLYKPHYYAVVKNRRQLARLLEVYGSVHPVQVENIPPDVHEMRLHVDW